MCSNDGIGPIDAGAPLPPVPADEGAPDDGASEEVDIDAAGVETAVDDPAPDDEPAAGVLTGAGVELPPLQATTTRLVTASVASRLRLPELTIGTMTVPPVSKARLRNR
jgi:hypothetical protein